MTHTQLAKRVAYWCQKLMLEPWQIVTSIEDDPHDQERKHGRSVHASCRTSPSYLRAEIEFATSWVKDPAISEQERDETIVHELLHCLFRDLDTAADALSSAVAPVAEELWEDRYKHELEQLVDRLAVTIVLLNKD